MKVELQITLKKGIRAVISEKDLKNLLILKHARIEDNVLILSSPIMIDSKSGNELANFIRQKFVPLFPTMAISGGNNFGDYRVSGSEENCIKYLKEFNEHYDYDFFTVWMATAVYLAEKKKFNFRGTLKNFNFIRRDLAMYCVQVLDYPDRSLITARTYLKYVTESGKGTRGKRLQRLDIDRELRESLGFDRGDRDSGESTGLPLGGDNVEQSDTSLPTTGDGGGDSTRKSNDGLGHLQSGVVKPIVDWGINKNRKLT